jgi:hypothetical protein
LGNTFKLEVNELSYAMNYKILILLLILLWLIFPLHGQVLTVSGEGKADFGRYPANLSKEVSFKLRNTGKQLLVIKEVRKTCGCSGFELTRKEIPPNGTAILKTWIKSNSISGPYTKNIYIISNDVKHRIYPITIFGNAIPLLRILPSNKIHAGSLTAGKIWKQKLVLKALKKNIKLGQATIKSVFPVNISIQEKKGKDHEIMIEAGPERKTPVFKCEITVPVLEPAGWKPAVITITGKVSEN